MIIMVWLMSIAASLEQTLNEDVTGGADWAAGDQQKSGIVEEEQREQMNEQHGQQEACQRNSTFQTDVHFGGHFAVANFEEDCLD